MFERCCLLRAAGCGEDVQAVADVQAVLDNKLIHKRLGHVDQAQGVLSVVSGQGQGLHDDDLCRMDLDMVLPSREAHSMWGSPAGRNEVAQGIAR